MVECRLGSLRCYNSYKVVVDPVADLAFPSKGPASRPDGHSPASDPVKICPAYRLGAPRKVVPQLAGPRAGSRKDGLALVVPLVAVDNSAKP